MEKKECPEKDCDKVIEGYHESHVNFLMKQHQLKHSNEREKKKND